MGRAKQNVSETIKLRGFPASVDLITYSELDEAKNFKDILDLDLILTPNAQEFIGQIAFVSAKTNSLLKEKNLSERIKPTSDYIELLKLESANSSKSNLFARNSKFSWTPHLKKLRETELRGDMDADISAYDSQFKEIAALARVSNTWSSSVEKEDIKDYFRILQGMYSFGLSELYSNGNRLAVEYQGDSGEIFSEMVVCSSMRVCKLFDELNDNDNHSSFKNKLEQQISTLNQEVNIVLSEQMQQTIGPDQNKQD